MPNIQYAIGKGPWRATHNQARKDRHLPPNDLLADWELQARYLDAQQDGDPAWPTTPA